MQALVVVGVHPLNLLVGNNTKVDQLGLNRREGDVLKAVIRAAKLIGRIRSAHDQDIFDADAVVSVLIVAWL